MKLVSEYNLHHSPAAQAAEQVVSLVDSLLQSQDLNQDGLLSPSELLSPPLPHTQDAIKDGNAPQQWTEEELTEPVSDRETTDPEAQEERAHEELQPQNDEQPQQEEQPEGEELINQQIPEAPAAEQGQDHHRVPVHQGQPEI